jgi:hypothetical protein
VGEASDFLLADRGRLPIRCGSGTWTFDGASWVVAVVRDRQPWLVVSVLALGLVIDKASNVRVPEQSVRSL